MAGDIKIIPLRQFGGISSLQETTHFGEKLSRAKNLLLRPWGGFKGIPFYERLWGIGSSATVQSTLLALRPPAATSQSANVNTTDNTLTVYSHWMLTNERVRLATTNTLPAPLETGTDYYVRDINTTTGTLKLSATSGGAEINLTTQGTGTITITPQRVLNTSDKTIAVRVSRQGKSFLFFQNLTNQKCRGLFYLGDDGSFSGDYDFTAGTPSYEVLALRLDDTARWQGSYFHGQWMLGNGVDKRVCVQLSRTHTPGKWRQAGNNDRPSAPVISLTAPSTSGNVQASWTIPAGGGAGQRAGAATLTFTANADNFPGSAGNSRIQVRITYNSSAVVLSSSLSGNGTISSPYLYTLTTAPNAAHNSNNAIVAFVNSDTKVMSILTASTSASDNTADTNSWAYTALSGGTGTGNSEGFGNRTVSVYARFWDAGTNNLGYEGISSDKSNTIVIPANAANDISVVVTKNPAAGGGRFQYIRVYLQFGEDEEATWQLVDPDNPIDNTTSGTATITIGSETEMGQEMYADQHQPLEGTHIVQCNRQMWLGGTTDFPDRLYPSKPAVDDEKAPEGANVDAYELLQSLGASGGEVVTAMYSDNYRLHVHTARGVNFIDPDNPDNQQQPPLLAGAINASALAPWTGSQIFYLGADLQLYEFNGTRYGKRDADFAANEAGIYIRERVDATAVGQRPERVFMFADPHGQLLWYWLPGTDGELTGFAYDFLAKGIVGEFDHPKIYAAARMEPERPETVFADEDGNLFVWDSTVQNDHGDSFPVVDAFTEYTTPDTPPVGQSGYGAETWIQTGKDYRQAYIAEMETGMMDFGAPAVRKQFLGLVWTSLPGSRALVECTITTKGGQTITRYYGDLGTHTSGRQSHKIVFNCFDTALKVKMRILSAEQKPWVIRDLSVQYKPASGV